MRAGMLCVLITLMAFFDVVTAVRRLGFLLFGIFPHVGVFKQRNPYSSIKASSCSLNS